ncbi:MAG: amino acid ABC transporter permease [Rhodospirillum sp.]|nr:amino acid ABC transporter permease [Rhodospirillum sp.]MCF8490568.1 amino acid ABC transporter permease [Rhodospirillum sp.]MCF8502119.1 amino acid ABC transporter permease [Rhodospirillum sp.]
MVAELIEGYQVVLSDPYLSFVLTGVGNTLLLFSVSWVTAVPIALALVMLRSSRVSGLRIFSVWYVEYHRNIPLLVQVLIWYFAIPVVLPPPVNDFINRHGSEIIYATIALGLFSAAYMAEDIRGGIRAIPRGQYDAASAIGLSYVGTMTWVILPQALRLSAVPMVGQTLILFKITSLASVIGVGELIFQARQIESETFRVFQAFSVVTLCYMVGAFTIMSVGGAIARRVQLTRR